VSGPQPPLPGPGPAADAALRAGDPVLLLGGTGLVARHLVPLLRSAGFLPVALSRSPPPPGVLPPQTPWIPFERARCLEGPAAWPAALVELHRRPRVGWIDIVADEPAPLAALLAQRGPGRTLVLGSAAVFGEAQRGRRYVETDPPQPATPAMRAKVELEAAVAAAWARGQGASLLRCAYPYGPGHGPLTPLGRRRDLFERLASGEEQAWTTAGALAPLQPLWAPDLARTLLELLLRPARPRPLYHVAGPETLDWDDYLACLCEAAGGEPRIRRLPLADLLARGSAARWLAEYLRNAASLDDGLLRREVWAPPSRLPERVGDWADWCRGPGA